MVFTTHRLGRKQGRCRIERAPYAIPIARQYLNEKQNMKGLRFLHRKRLNDDNNRSLRLCLYADASHLVSVIDVRLKQNISGDELAERILSKPLARQQSLARDPRTLHRKLFRGKCKFAGRYRDPSDHGGGVVGVRSRMLSGPKVWTPGASASELKQEMRKFCILLAGALDHPPVGETAREFIVASMARFFLLHPFADGNGRTCRLMVRLWSNLMGCPLNDAWTVDTRPYGAAFCYGMIAYPMSPGPLNLIMAPFFSLGNEQRRAG